MSREGKRLTTAEHDRAIREKTTPFRDAVLNGITFANLKDHGGTAKVEMRWDLNDKAKQDQIFEFSINGQKAYIDLEELLSYTRLI